MTALLDTSILIDHLRGRQAAVDLLLRERTAGEVHASEITRLELLAGMRRSEQAQTLRLLSTLRWHDVDADVAQEAGALGRRWLPSHRGLDSADLAIAATAVLLDARLLTLNVRHFPMFSELCRPY